MIAALSIRGLAKRFGPVAALAGVDLEVRGGSVHALLGENGAGKSTLMHVVDGLLRPDAGTMTLDGVPFAPRSAVEARAAGIGMVHQHFTTIPALRVWENIALAAGWDPRDGRARAATRLEARGVVLPLDRPAGELSVGGRQQLELQKALAAEPRILLLDEPTGVLTPPEVERLFTTVRAFTAAGGAVVLITHKLDEALERADAITVLRRGSVAGSWMGRAALPDRTDLLRAMLGDRPSAAIPRAAPSPGAVIAEVSRLTLRAGEVIGIAGIEGNGQRELLRSFGAGAFIAEDRTTEGTIAEFTLTENLALRPATPGVRTIDWSALRHEAVAAIEGYAIKAESPEVPVGTLSGGNQQKVVVARALAGAPALVVAENPARGLDVRAAEEIFQRLRAAAAAGAAVLFSSTDLDEILVWADRVFVIVEGELRVPPPGADRSAIGALMVSRDRP